MYYELSQIISTYHRTIEHTSVWSQSTHSQVVESLETSSFIDRSERD